MPHTAACLIESQNLDCVVAIGDSHVGRVEKAESAVHGPPPWYSQTIGCLTAGCLIKGDTQHFEYICEAVTQVHMNHRHTCTIGTTAMKNRYH